MRVFVTGGSGFVGGHVIEALVGEHTVLAMARSERAAQAVAALGATPVLCSLDDVEAAHLAGCDAVVHAAAMVEDWGPDEAFEKGNVDGTRRVLAAAKGAGVPRFVLVSSNAVALDGTDLTDVDEARPSPARFPFAYARTKAEAERLVLAADGISTIALRPCLIWGPRDNSFLPTLRRIVADDGFWWMGGGSARISTTNVHNLVAAIRLAVGSDARGAYFVADEGDVTVREFYTAIAETDGLSLGSRSLPAGLVRFAARMLEVLWRGRAAPPPLTVMAAEVSSRDMTVRTDKARAVLGWRPVIDRAGGLAELRGAKRAA